MTPNTVPSYELTRHIRAAISLLHTMSTPQNYVLRYWCPDTGASEYIHVSSDSIDEAKELAESTGTVKALLTCGFTFHSAYVGVTE